MTKKAQKGMKMKTTEINFSKEDTTKDQKTMNAEAAISVRSLRPQKSMVRVKSLRPKRLVAARRVSIHPLERK